MHVSNVRTVAPAATSPPADFTTKPVEALLFWALTAPHPHPALPNPALKELVRRHETKSTPQVRKALSDYLLAHAGA